ncbi:hypothetical protein EV424DRAFT_1555307 [Suillus variegatus]|nr:hypothetical protein EV424DRAFT_1555307 [Suillus variegatus]
MKMWPIPCAWEDKSRRVRQAIIEYIPPFLQHNSVDRKPFFDEQLVCYFEAKILFEIQHCSPTPINLKFKLFGTTHQQYPLQLWGGDTLQLLLPLVLFLRCFQPRDDDHVGGALGLEAVGGLELLRLALSRSSPPKYRHDEKGFDNAKHCQQIHADSFNVQYSLMCQWKPLDVDGELGPLYYDLGVGNMIFNYLARGAGRDGDLVGNSQI